jgi:hypothetical protein
MKNTLKLSAMTAGLAVLMLTACGGPSLETQLNLIISTTSAAVDIASPQYAAVLAPYFASVTKFVDEVTTELESRATGIQKAAAIAQDAAAIAQPNLSGVPATLAVRVGAIAPVIADLVAAIQSLKAEFEATPGGANAFFAAHKSLKPPSAKALKRIEAKNAALKVKLAVKH